MPIRLPASRPRVLVRRAELPLLRRRAKTTHRAEYDALLALVAAPIPEKDDGASAAARLAFLHLLTGERAHADACAAALERVMALPVLGGYFEGTRRLRALAYAYDWCHGAFDAHLLSRVGHAALAYAHALHVTGEIWPGNHVAGHEVNEVPYIIAACIAIGDEIPGAPAMLAAMLARWDRMQECYRFFLERGSFQQSYSYCAAYLPEIALVFRLREAAFGGDEFRRNPWFRNLVPWWTYALRGDDTFIRYGDYFVNPPMTNPAYWLPFAACATRYRDPIARHWVERMTIAEAEPQAFVFDDRARPVKAQPPSTLPRNRRFPGMGVAIARDWGDGTVAALKCSPIYLHNHCHRDQNQITIWHKGDLAIDSGAYDGYETPHWYDYYIRTVAHNTIVVHDPAETMVSRGREKANDGGQRFVNRPDWAPRTLADLRSPKFRDGTMRAWKDGGDWAYACGDASNCYDRRKLKRFLRHVVFVHDHPHPGAVSLLVIDDVELAKDGLTPRWLLHTIEKPEVDGTRIAVRQDRGRLTVHVAEPAPPRIELIGGPGDEFRSDGANRAMTRPMPPPHTPGAWRIELSPAEPAKRVRFVTWLVPADADAPPEPAPTFELDAKRVVVRQGDRAVVAAIGAAKAPMAGRVITVRLAGR